MGQSSQHCAGHPSELPALLSYGTGTKDSPPYFAWILLQPHPGPCFEFIGNQKSQQSGAGRALSKSSSPTPG